MVDEIDETRDIQRSEEYCAVDFYDGYKTKLKQPNQTDHIRRRWNNSRAITAWFLLLFKTTTIKKASAGEERKRKLYRWKRFGDASQCEFQNFLMLYYCAMRNIKKKNLNTQQAAKCEDDMWANWNGKKNFTTVMSHQLARRSLSLATQFVVLNYQTLLLVLDNRR